jgi:hypothetical protein
MFAVSKITALFFLIWIEYKRYKNKICILSNSTFTIIKTHSHSHLGFLLKLFS